MHIESQRLIGVAHCTLNHIAVQCLGFSVRETHLSVTFKISGWCKDCGWAIKQRLETVDGPSSKDWRVLFEVHNNLDNPATANMMGLQGTTDEGDTENCVYQPMKNPRGGYKATLFVFCKLGRKTDLGVESCKLNEANVSSSEEDDVCPTCFEDYDAENPKIMTKCNHHYHLSCILEWMERSDTCPICNQEMDFEVL